MKKILETQPPKLTDKDKMAITKKLIKNIEKRICKICYKTFKNRSDEHVASTHSIFYCDGCGIKMVGS